LAAARGFGSFGKTCRPRTKFFSVEALYFSMVTITTLGYGDFVPAGPVARGIIVWELATGLLTLVLAFPLVSTRATTPDSD
jgi:voltage-gated potassium channel Kch